jgi:hypothetical protein
MNSTSTVSSSETAPSHRSISGFWVAGSVAVLGVAAAILWAVIETVTAIDAAAGLARGVVPGAVTAEVDDPGTVVVYYEGEPVPPLADLRLEVTGPKGTRIAVRAYQHDLRYDSPVDPVAVGTAVADFEAPQDGAYLVETAYAPSGTARLAVGGDVGVGFAETLVGPGLLALGSMLAALVIAVLTAVRSAREQT